MEILPALPSNISTSLPSTQVDSLISQAIDKNVSVETMERLLAMRRELKAEYAREQFNLAMSQFQTNCPVIKKTKAITTKTGAIAYRYAPIESIVSQVKHLLLEYGLSYAIDTKTEGENVTAICTAKHSLGHTESSSITVPLGRKTEVMSDTQVVAAALTFAKRYAFCNAFGILTGDQDTDATPQQQKVVLTYATEKQLSYIKNLMEETNTPLDKVLGVYKVESLKNLSGKAASECIERLKRYKQSLSVKDSQITTNNPKAKFKEIDDDVPYPNMPTEED